jgi:hypothetical protein
MSVQEINELLQRQNERELRRVEGKPEHIEINERALQAYKEEFGKKGLTISSEEDYPMGDFMLVAKQKEFDSLVDPKQGIRKVIISMVRQPVTVFNKNGKPEVKDALYYNGYYYGTDKRGNDLSAEFHEGSYKKPKLSFVYTSATEPYDPKTGERRGTYKTVGNTVEHYIFLSEDKKERRKQLEDIVQYATGTSIGNLSTGGHLSYRIPTANNDHSATHGGMFSFNIFSDLSLEELGELQNQNYYTEKETGQIKNAKGQRVAYDHSTKKVETSSGR